MSVLHTINQTCLDTINYTIELVKTYLKCREYLSFLNGHYILENQISIGNFIDLECVRKFGYKAEFMITCFLHELHYFTQKNGIENHELCIIANIYPLKQSNS